MELLTEEQLVLVKDAFALFDKSGDGCISIKELGEVMRTLGQNPTEPELQNIINDVDTNHSKVIEFDEFCQLMVERMAERDTKAEAEQAFRVFAKDQHGCIPFSELRHVLLNLGDKVSGSEVEEMLLNADLDGDGAISFEEFVPMVMPALLKQKKTEEEEAEPEPTEPEAKPETEPEEPK